MRLFQPYFKDRHGKMKQCKVWYLEMAGEKRKSLGTTDRVKAESLKALAESQSQRNEFPKALMMELKRRSLQIGLRSLDATRDFEREVAEYSF